MLNIKQKWDIDAELGKMLRDAEKQQADKQALAHQEAEAEAEVQAASMDEAFTAQLLTLCKDFRVDSGDVVALARQGFLSR
ncbi:hypothetical protein VRRI112168_14940 [Vreelandella rituensis]|uniref:Uncharacterized protein n=1 Tax=Vreelandella rituensis TaxID=2282306 RepID=A0A368UA03_9GAMM|nr:hypothetical protein [Halomonas rituensis]RCV93781.1 hypothetical protein DU506_01090 [Halomonas rituensis]